MEKAEKWKIWRSLVRLLGSLVFVVHLLGSGVLPNDLQLQLSFDLRSFWMIFTMLFFFDARLSARWIVLVWRPPKFISTRFSVFKSLFKHYYPLIFVQFQPINSTRCIPSTLRNIGTPNLECSCASSSPAAVDQSPVARTCHCHFGDCGGFFGLSGRMVNYQSV